MNNNRLLVIWQSAGHTSVNFTLSIGMWAKIFAWTKEAVKTDFSLKIIEAIEFVSHALLMLNFLILCFYMFDFEMCELNDIVQRSLTCGITRQ